MIKDAEEADATQLEFRTAVHPAVHLIHPAPAFPVAQFRLC